MDTWALSCVALCILVTKHTDAGVTQTPRHKVTEMGRAVTLNCEPISGHAALLWYRQTIRTLEFLIYFNNKAPVDDSGMPKGRFFAKMPNASLSTLEIQSTEPRDSAVYFCASSTATVLQNHPLPVQKPFCVPFLQLPAVLSKVFPILLSPWEISRSEVYQRQNKTKQNNNNII
ncbi:T-cell receptor beta chain V region YT35 [Tupaia chinensis]|nr:T-cell receptor beta chain V region YT35 [Tupaia chinensis]